MRHFSGHSDRLLELRLRFRLIVGVLVRVTLHLKLLQSIRDGITRDTGD
jgi:hypothetical protein